VVLLVETALVELYTPAFATLIYLLAEKESTTVGKNSSQLNKRQLHRARKRVPTKMKRCQALLSLPAGMLLSNVGTSIYFSFERNLPTFYILCCRYPIIERIPLPPGNELTYREYRAMAIAFDCERRNRQGLHEPQTG